MPVKLIVCVAMLNLPFIQQQLVQVFIEPWKNITQAGVVEHR
jgi:hypothetical protein